MEVIGPSQEEIRVPSVKSKVPSVKSKVPSVKPKSPGAVPSVGSKSPGLVQSLGSKSPRAVPSVGSRAPSARPSRSARIKSATLKAVIKGIHEKKNARKTVRNILDKIGVKKLGIKIRGRFLKSICSDSGVCIAFGKERKTIFDFFNGFSKFDYLKKTRAIGAKSANGFVKELEYEREGYKAYAILKSSKQQTADNLAYEYMVGTLITRSWLTKVPCFIETYASYRYKSEEDWTRSQTSALVELDKMLVPIYSSTFKYGETCDDSRLTCILVQHIKDATSIGEKIRLIDVEFIANDLMTSLYQVYYALNLYKSKFTHYDLHSNNVLLYLPVSGKYIEYHYHLADGSIVIFKSQYIVKIIDYGRSYINELIDSKDESDHLCKVKKCNLEAKGEKCGNKSGYKWLEPPATAKNHFICSSVNNQSHDLRLLNDINNAMYWDDDELQEMGDVYSHLEDILGMVLYEESHGTPHVESGNHSVGEIVNVEGAELVIRENLQSPNQKQLNDEYYSSMKKLGVLHVYGDRDMEFTEQ
jgi:hypothetical protein